MFGSTHYVPILQCKRGELTALREMSKERRALITPLLELVPDTKRSDDSNRVGAAVKALAESWSDRNVFIDCRLLRTRSAVNDKHTIADFFYLASARKLKVIPVGSPILDADSQHAIRDAVKSEGRGVAIRLTVDDLSRDDAGFILRSLVEGYGVDRSQVDLIVDYGFVGTHSATMVQHSMRHVVQEIPHVKEWRTLTVASGTLPKSLGELPLDQWTTIPRVEWMAWKQLATKPGQLKRIPSYGDYAVDHPYMPIKGSPRLPATLRYSHADNFLVWRGHLVNEPGWGHDQIYDICKSLVRREEFAGKDFSQGDFEIHRRATTECSTGAGPEWRYWATNHYLELVASQLASLPSP